jgi:hypothetical protein
MRLLLGVVTAVAAVAVVAAAVTTAVGGSEECAGGIAGTAAEGGPVCGCGGHAEVAIDAMLICCFSHSSNSSGA